MKSPRLFIPHGAGPGRVPMHAPETRTCPCGCQRSFVTQHGQIYFQEACQAKVSYQRRKARKKAAARRAKESR